MDDREFIERNFSDMIAMAVAAATFNVDQDDNESHMDPDMRERRRKATQERVDAIMPQGFEYEDQAVPRMPGTNDVIPGVPDELICMFCSDKWRAPLYFPCKHQPSCKGCMRKLLETCVRKNDCRCPICRAPFEKIEKLIG
jgi:rubrerythrin